MTATQLSISSETLSSKTLREIPEGTPDNSPLRIICSLESRIKTLDEEQQKAAAEYPNGPQRLRGLAGTGKTVLFAKRAAKIHAEHPDWNLAFVFFTRSLYEQIIKERIGLYYFEMTGKEPNWEKLRVLHAWGAKDQDGFYRTLAIKCGIKPKTVKDVETEIGKVSPGKAFEYICDGLEQQSHVPVLYDAILIDEGQDLPASFYRLARNTLSAPKRLYWAYDEAQGMDTLTVPQPMTIFGRHADGTPVVDLGGNKLSDGKTTSPFYEGTNIRKAYPLNRCYRTPRLLLMAAHAVNMGLLRTGGPLQGVSRKEEWEVLGYKVIEGDFSDASVKAQKFVTVTRPADKSPHPIDQEGFEAQAALGDPLTIQAFGNEPQEQGWIAEQVANDLKQGLAPSDIMITALCGKDEKNYLLGIKNALATYGIKGCIAGIDTKPSGFGLPDHVTLTNIHRAKGNEAWKAYACRFHYATQPLAWRKETELRKRNEAFVAMTRARVWCVVTGLEDPIFDELQKAKEQYPNLVFPAFNKASLKRVNDEHTEEGDRTEVTQ
jgi:superfamily I DNA and RNA helicase